MLQQLLRTRPFGGVAAEHQLDKVAELRGEELRRQGRDRVLRDRLDHLEHVVGARVARRQRELPESQRRGNLGLGERR